MKKTLSILMMCCATQAFAQKTEPTGRVYAGLNFKYGWLKERMNPMPATGVYPGTLNYSRSKMNRDYDNSLGFDAQLGYFFSNNKKWGIATGIVYLKGSGVISIDSTHFEYMSVDSRGDVFRQVVTNTAPIREELEITNMSIPLLIKFRTPISDKFGFNIDGGIVYNVRMETSYSGTAAYNYEAIYKFDMTTGQPVAVYDNQAVPHPSDWLITVKEYNENQSDGNVNEYFTTLQSQGYNVGLDKVAAKSGKIEEKSGTIGILLQPSFSYRLTEAFSLNLGGYYMYQKFSNSDSRTSQMTDGVNEYNSLLHNTPRRRQYNSGFNIGLSLCF
jgi:hypothetical protein